MTESELPPTLLGGGKHPEALPTALRWSHALLAPRLRHGDIVIDATAGNGHDTLFLAQHVLPGGRVFAFDVQPEALKATRQRLAASGYDLTNVDAISLFEAGHEAMEKHLPADFRGRVRAVMFNLGYRPCGDKTQITRAATTLRALEIAHGWLEEQGLITIVCYPGHDGGQIELQSVADWTARLPADQFEAQQIAFVNLAGNPPCCFVIRRRTRLTRRPPGETPPREPH